MLAFSCLSIVQEKAVQVVDHLRESHWTCSCVVTMSKFQDICGGPEEASAVLSHLSETGKARYISAHKKEFLEVLHLRAALVEFSEPNIMVKSFSISYFLHFS